jgi:hypothetical protein
MTDTTTDRWPTTPADNYAVHDERFRRWFGLAPRATLTDYPCPRTIVGKRCQAWKDRAELCICQRHDHILDHSRGWTDTTGDYVHTAEPYDFTGEELAALTADLDALGVGVTVRGMSLWYPGHTVLLIMRSKGNVT